MKSSVESIKDAKAKEFPVSPEKTAKEPKKAEPKSAPKKKAGPSKADLMKMISEMED
jgi:hypothetical protein